MEFKKKVSKSKKEAGGIELIPCKMWQAPVVKKSKNGYFAPESDNVVILVPYQVKTHSATGEQRVLPKSNESVRKAFFPELHHSSLRHPEASAPPSTSWLESGSATGGDNLLVGLMGPKKRRIESGKKLVFSVSEWQKCSV